VQIHCFKTTTKVSDEFKIGFLAKDVMDVLGLVYG
jgi:hypothetical protein